MSALKVLENSFNSSGKARNRFIYSFIQVISKAPLQVHYYSEALLTQHVHCVTVSCRNPTGNCEWRTCPRSLRGSYIGIQPHDPLDERRQIYQWATMPHRSRAQILVNRKWPTQPIRYKRLPRTANPLTRTNSNSVTTQLLLWWWGWSR